MVDVSGPETSHPAATTETGGSAGSTRLGVERGSLELASGDYSLQSWLVHHPDHREGSLVGRLILRGRRRHSLSSVRPCITVCRTRAVAFSSLRTTSTKRPSWSNVPQRDASLATPTKKNASRREPQIRLLRTLWKHRPSDIVL